jgi:hypothetical protein
LIHMITAGTSRVAHGPLCLHAIANTPAGLIETCSLMRFHQLRPSPKPGRVGSCITLFEACSAFTHVTACTLAKSPSDSLHQRLQQSRCLHCCSDCYRVERTSSRAGLPPAVDHHLFTAHPVSPLIREQSPGTSTVPYVHGRSSKEGCRSPVRRTTRASVRSSDQLASPAAPESSTL